MGCHADRLQSDAIRCPRIEIKRRISTYHLGNEKVSLVLDQAKASLEMEDEREQEDEGEIEERE